MFFTYKFTSVNSLNGLTAILTLQIQKTKTKDKVNNVVITYLYYGFEIIWETLIYNVNYENTYILRTYGKLWVSMINYSTGKHV